MDENTTPRGRRVDVEEKPSLKEKVYNQLIKDITAGIIKPNDILVEGALIKQFEVSKAPVREALIELCKDNYLKSIPRVGYQVVSCSLKEIVDILEFRVDLEVSNLKRSFSRMTAESLSVFDTYHIRSGDELKEYSLIDHWLHNQEFHLMLCSLSGNTYTYRILEQLLKQNARFFAQYHTFASYHETESQGRYHANVIAALKENNFEKACNLLTSDINSVKVQIQRLLQNELV